jgi:plastocyanin
MRATWLAASVMVLAACGGEKPADQSAAAPAAPAATAPAAATGATHDVNMVMEGSNYRFVPAEVSIKAGDMVSFHNVSGGPHNVQFHADSIPAGAAAVLDANMANRMGPLASNLLVSPNEVYSISFAGAPAGEYRFTCLPHAALGMHGKITVQ